MTDQELDILLTERCRTLDLTKTAMDNLEQLFKDNYGDKDFLGGFEQNEIKAIFDRFEYQIDRRLGGSIIKTRIGLYIEDTDQIGLDIIRPIGYYALDTDFSGVVLDDWKSQRFAKLKEVQAKAQSQRFCTTFNFAPTHPSPPTTQKTNFGQKSKKLKYTLNLQTKNK
jgi:hypothetical protein